MSTPYELFKRYPNPDQRWNVYHQDPFGFLPRVYMGSIAAPNKDQAVFLGCQWFEIPKETVVVEQIHSIAAPNQETL